MGVERFLRASGGSIPLKFAFVGPAVFLLAVGGLDLLGVNRSQERLQIIADVLDRPIQPLSGHPGSCLGAAWMAALGCGLSTDWQGAQAFVALATPVEPQTQNRSVYATAYGDYRALYSALKPLFHTMGAAR